VSTTTGGRGFVHRFVPARAAGPQPTLLLLHGTGGDENDLLQVGSLIHPGAALLSPRGKVLENGMPRFFRRLAEGVFDEEDLVVRARELADFVLAMASAHELDAARVYAVGFSNGANMAAAVLLLQPRLLAGAVLLRPMVPLEPDPLPDLSGRPVLVAGGRSDAVVPPAETERLVELLRRAGAEVTVHWEEGGHWIGGHELEVARGWLASR
jgi:predicted esterase